MHMWGLGEGGQPNSLEGTVYMVHLGSRELLVPNHHYVQIHDSSDSSYGQLGKNCCTEQSSGIQQYVISETS